MNVLVCDDERQIVDSIIETLEKKTEETQAVSVEVLLGQLNQSRNQV